MRAAGTHVGVVLAAAGLWGTTGTVAHHAPAGSVQALIGLATFGFGGLLLFGLDIRGVLALLQDRRCWSMIAAGAIGVISYAGCYYWSMGLVGVAVGNAVALGSGPVFAAVLEMVIDRRPVRGWWVVALLVSLAGIACLAASTGSYGAGTRWTGILLALAAGAGYAVYSWAAARLILAGRPSRPVMATVFVVAAAPLLIVFFGAGPGPLLSTCGMVILAYLAIVPMALAYLLFGYGLRGLSASTATTLALAEPVVATLLATLVLHERLGPVGWTGLALIMTGILLIAVAERASASHRNTPTVRISPG